MFSPYFKYCAEQTACQQYCKEQDRDNQVFKAYLAVSYAVTRICIFKPSFCPLNVKNYLLLFVHDKMLQQCNNKNVIFSGAKLNETATV